MTLRPIVSWCCASLLWVLTVLFCFRIFAQLTVYFVDISFLPSFDRWHSEAMPYWALLLIQVIILIIMIITNYFYIARKLILRPLLGRWLLIFGVIYLVSMIIRLILGLTMFTGDRWFANHIPTFFHFVLASWILIIGMVHFKGDSRNLKNG